MPLRIQLAVQGGGAKVCALMAALDAVQDLERKGKIQVTRLVGTSAGSIAAGLYAADHDFAGLRLRAIESRERLRSIVPRLDNRLAAYFRVLRGKPVWSQKKIRELLDYLFGQQHIHRFGDFNGRALVVVATDLTNGRAIEYSADRDPGQSVTNAILDSCAIPFFFRGAGQRDGSALIVDGGICENLPVAYCGDEKQHGIIVGISFQPRAAGETPSDVARFARALLDTAMENSVRRAQQRLLEDRLHLIATDIDTLDFQKALDTGFGSNYDAVYKKAWDFFNNLTQPQPATATQIRFIPEDGWETDSATTLQKHADIFEAQHRNAKVAYAEAHVIVQADSLKVGANTDLYQQYPDQLTYRLRFAPDQVPVYCHRVAVQGDTPEDELIFLQSFRREAWDRNGAPVPTIDLKALDSQKKERAYLLFFKSILQPGDPNAPYELYYSHHVVQLLKKLNRGDADELGLRLSRASRAVGRIILVAFIPEGSQVSMTPSTKDNDNAREQGRPMSPAELNREGIFAPPNYYAIGWIGENVEAGKRFAVTLRRQHDHASPSVAAGTR